MLGAIISLHLHANANLRFTLFYAIPCMFAALMVNTRWASVFVLACSLASPLVQYHNDSDYRLLSVFLWNLFNHVAMLEMIVLIIGRIKMDFSKTGDRAV
jgi:hypothetical protein